MESIWAGKVKVTGNGFDRRSSQRSAVPEVRRTLSKPKASFNQIETPNSGFGEFEPNFATILDSGLFESPDVLVLAAEIRVLKIGQFAAVAAFKFNSMPSET